MMERRDLLKAIAALPGVPMVQTIDATAPDTTLVITYEQQISPRDIERIKEAFAGALPSVRVAVLDGGAKLQMVHGGVE